MRNKKLIVLLSVVAALVLVIVVCGATFLVRNVNAYSYYNYSEQDELNYDGLVIDAAGIKKNSSMFFLDEVGVKNKVEKALPNVGVINIERKFPDRITINYVVYEKSFQYLNGGRYYQCYSSGKIGGSSDTPIGDYFTVIPSGATSTAQGAFFQGENGSDRKYITAFIKYMYGKGLNDALINERIAFIDLSRDGFVYIRTGEGASIEIEGGYSDFKEMLDIGWSAFVGFLSTNPVNTSSGLIRVWKNSKGFICSHLKSGAELGKDEEGNRLYYTDNGYYTEHYVNK